jgi:RNA 3'-terminal phosphate cyclase (ATP)
MLAEEKMIQIDGAQGEGGGQMLRTSLSLSLLTKQPFQMENIRAGRKKPGLLRQHLAAVLAAAQIGEAEVEGAHLGSQALCFTPKTIRPGEYRFVIGTAGSGTLVFQTVLPALMLAPGPSTLTIEGGTHNQAAPPFDFLERTFLPFLRRMGPQVTLSLDRYGFYPAGGGCFRADIVPCQQLAPLEVGTREGVMHKRTTAIVANLPGHIAKREIATIEGMFAGGIESRIINTKRSPGPGNVVLVEVESKSVTEIFTSFGQLGVTAENVAKEAVREAREYLASSAVAGEYLTDQLLLPFALAGAGRFTALKLSRHAVTNMEIIQHFLRVRFAIEEREGYREVRIVSSFH